MQTSNDTIKATEMETRAKMNQGETIKSMKREQRKEEWEFC